MVFDGKIAKRVINTDFTSFFKDISLNFLLIHIEELGKLVHLPKIIWLSENGSRDKKMNFLKDYMKIGLGLIAILSIW